MTPGLGTTTLLYDIDVAASLRNSASPTGVWLPPFTDDVTTPVPPAYGFSGLVATGSTGDPSVRSLSELGSSTLPLRNYQIPSTEPKDHDGAVLDFLFQMTFPGQTIWGARVGNPSRPTGTRRSRRGLSTSTTFACSAAASRS